ncbi:MAG: glycosyltransferase family 2 protein [Rhodobiaceae bacterium]|nr:glycosyltransferase family 2 protein [Rhodobiaceae bacterium]MCC0055982.1 glycosyltransferase family 2 protein [Rhodobiaceae bacterium]
MSDRKRPAQPVIGVIVPCYNEEDVLPVTASALCKKLQDLVDAGAVESASSVWLIDDGSRDLTWEVIEDLAARNERVRGVRLAANRGQNVAMLAGLMTAEGDALVTIDADMQDDIDVIPRMIDAWRRGADIVFGVRASRSGDGILKRLLATGFYRLASALGTNLPAEHGDFRLMSRRSVEALAEYGESNIYMRGIVGSLGLRTAIVEYDHLARAAGTTKYTLRRLISLALTAITSFSVWPLRIISLTGIAVSIGTVFGGIWVLWVALFSDRAVPGWASLMLPLFFLSGVQLVSLGVMGEYIGRIYMETKRRPRFLIETITQEKSDIGKAARSSRRKG